MKKIKLISSDIEGLELRREKGAHNYTRCSGSDDSDQLNEATKYLKNASFFVDALAWERIFGNK